MKYAIALAMLLAAHASASGECDPKNCNLQDDECFCSRRIEEGSTSQTSPNGFLCTGAFKPMLLRSREKDPCKMGWADIGGASR